MKQILNTDLACENPNFIEKNNNFNELDFGYCSVIKQNIKETNSDYITFFCDRLDLLDSYTIKLISLALSEELVEVLKKYFFKDNIEELSYLVVGLGNADFTVAFLAPT